MPQFLSGIVHFFRYFMRCKIQYLQERRIARKYASLLVQTTIAAVKAFDRNGGVNDLSHISGKLEDR